MVGSNGMDMIVDSGTSLLALPTEVYEKVLSTIDPVEEDCSNIDSLPDLEMSVGDYKFVIPPQLYVGKVKLDEAERGATLLQDRTWGPFRFRGSDKQKAAARREESGLCAEERVLVAEQGQLRARVVPGRPVGRRLPAALHGAQRLHRQWRALHPGHAFPPCLLGPLRLVQANHRPQEAAPRLEHVRLVLRQQ